VDRTVDRWQPPVRRPTLRPVPRLIPHVSVRAPSRRPRAVEHVSAEYAFGRSELPAVAAALRVRLRDRRRALDTPEQLRRALEEASSVGAGVGGGRIEVRRIPGALYTSESWQVRLESVAPAARAAVDEVMSEVRGVR
jgi:hypothetical protein